MILKELIDVCAEDLLVYVDKDITGRSDIEIYGDICAELVLSEKLLNSKVNLIEIDNNNHILVQVVMK